jgi:hypothetical protein
MPNYSALANELKATAGQLGASKQELQNIVDRGGDARRTNELLDGASQLGSKLQGLMANNQVTEQERQRKIAQLESDIELLRMIDSTSPDFDERMRSEREISRLSARLGTYKTKDALKFEDLLDEDGDEVKVVLTAALNDVAARQNLQRALQALEMLVRVAVFGATTAAKLAIAAG